MHLSTITLTALAASLAHGHGLIRSPAARDVGNATQKACGTAVVNIINKDKTDHVEGLPEAAAKDTGYHAADCNLWLCKGMQFADNAANVQTYKAGQVVPIKAYIRIPHEGPANVSILDTKTNKLIGTPLITWASYADEKLAQLPANNSDFSITIPELSGQCTTPGECVIQWWWYGTKAQQTYEGCVDFVVSSTPARFRRY